ncbi:MAG: hypothetical protein HYT12_04685 [Candidatus Liptonbacteria bacterium]|nr:hypothetical protein [Candidatus Liptonbacteria bacterium]
MKKYSAIFVIAAITIAAIIFFALQSAGPGEYDDFALCLKEKGVVFYGAFWCPHCQNQKKLFGKSQKLLPYLECSIAETFAIS